MNDECSEKVLQIFLYFVLNNIIITTPFGRGCVARGVALMYRRLWCTRL